MFAMALIELEMVHASDKDTKQEGKRNPSILNYIICLDHGDRGGKYVDILGVEPLWKRVTSSYRLLNPFLPCVKDRLLGSQFVFVFRFGLVYCLPSRAV